MLPAARITDSHTCPAWTAIVPHIGGVIVKPAAPTVLIGGLPAAGLGSQAVCVGPPNSVAFGSPVVLIGSVPAARITDLMAHGGTITGPGCPTVLIGGPAPPAPPPPPEPPEDLSPEEVEFMMQGGKSEEDLEKFREEQAKKDKKE